MQFLKHLLMPRHMVGKGTLEAIIDATSEGVLLARAVHNWRGQLMDFEFQFTNRRAAEILDRDSAQIIGQRVLKFLDPAQSKSCFERYSQVFRTGAELVSDVHYRLDGADHWYRVRIKKIDGGVVTFFDDVTLEHQVGFDHGTLEKMKESLLQTPDASLWIKTPLGMYTFANRGMRELTGLRFWQIVGKRDEDIFPVEVARDSLRSDQEVLRSRSSLTTIQQFSLGGVTRTVFTQKFPIMNEAGAIVAIGGIAAETKERNLEAHRSL